MNIARNKQSRQTAWPPRCIRGLCGFLLGKLCSRYFLLCAIALLFITPAVAVGQLGQAPMQNDGLVDRAAQGLGTLNAGGAGRMYYGVNGADRGLGYRGSYMTLGGYFPALEDDYGGLWAADTRGHLSNYGGFFSNIGVVRKQLLNGGSLLGFGVFWDYDGDQNQYEDQIIGDVDAMTFAGGYSYNQVGISGELLTDWGNIRSNGYIPVGTTGQSTGKYVSRNILCMQGINAALGGADFELGAYLPGLSDWAGVINVGGYAYGNTRYQLDNGADLVPWFGGVYTRLDMTFADNWDFSLQYNNDSYFDSTGFARLTYRLGGSRRRNVPDQMEQPMMRNEHIVRARQEAEIATNPDTGQPWRVIHVDNTTSSPATGNGSIVNPVASLGGNPPGGNPTAETLAVNDYDIILVHSSPVAYSNISATSVMFGFQASNQYLIGEGSSQTIPTVECGDLLVSTTINPDLYPTISPQPNNTGILIDSSFSEETISGFNIIASGTGILSLSTATNTTNDFNDISIIGGLEGIRIEGNANHDLTDNISFRDQTGVGLENNGRGEIRLAGTTFTDISGTAIETTAGTLTATNISVNNTVGNGVIVGGANQALFEMEASTISNSQEAGIVNRGDGSINVVGSQITGSGTHGVHTTSLASGSINIAQSDIDGAITSGGVSSNGIFMEGSTSVSLANTSTISNALNGVNVTGNAEFNMDGGIISSITNDGIILQPLAPATALDGSASLSNVAIVTIGDNGIRSIGRGAAGGGNVSFINSSMFGIGANGILGSQIGNPVAGSGALVRVERSSIRNTVLNGIQVSDSNLRVTSSNLQNNGGAAISLINGSSALIDLNRITGSTTTGIQATANETLTFNPTDGFTNVFNNLTATNNTITVETSGIAIQGAINVNGAATPPSIISQGIVRANISQNNITATDQIGLSTINGVIGTTTTSPVQSFPPLLTGGLIVNNGRPQGIQIVAQNQAQLSALNNGADVSETPTPVGDITITTTVDYSLTNSVTLPPQ